MFSVCAPPVSSTRGRNWWPWAYSVGSASSREEPCGVSEVANSWADMPEATSATSSAPASRYRPQRGADLVRFGMVAFEGFLNVVVTPVGVADWALC